MQAAIRIFGGILTWCLFSSIFVVHTSFAQSALHLTGSDPASIRARDGAWQSAQAISQSTQGITGTQLAFNKHDDTGMTIWAQRPDSTHQGIFASRYVNGQWDTPQLVVSTSEYIYDDAVAVGPNGTAVAVWTQVLLGDSTSHLRVWASEFTPDAGWAAPQKIDTNDSLGSDRPKAAILPNGKAVVVWYESIQGTHRVFSNEYTVSTGWGTARAIDAFSHTGSFDPEIAFDNKGNGYAVWSQTWQGKNMVWGNRYVVDRGWVAPQAIAVNKPDFSAGPHIGFDDSGNAVAVWNETGGLYAAKYIRNQGWTAEVLVTSEEVYDPVLAVNGAGNVFVVFTEIKPVGEDSHGITQLASSVWAVRFTTTGGWETPTALQYPNGYDANHPAVAIDEAGNAIALWSGYNGPSNYSGSIVRIYANRYVVGSGWVSRKVIDTTNTYGAYTFPQIAIDGSGNGLAVWEQQSGPTDFNTDVWFNRFQ